MNRMLDDSVPSTARTPHSTTRVAVIDKGAIVWGGTVSEFTAQPELQARYLQV